MAFSFFLKSQRRATLCQRLEEAVAAEMARGSSQSQTKLGELEKMMEKRDAHQESGGGKQEKLEMTRQRLVCQ